MAQVLLRGANIRGVTAFQDLMHDNVCWGCGRRRPRRPADQDASWDGDTVADPLGRRRRSSPPGPTPHPQRRDHRHAAGLPRRRAPAIADRYRAQRTGEIGSRPARSGAPRRRMAVQYLRPTPDRRRGRAASDRRRRRRAVQHHRGRALSADGKDRARATVNRRPRPRAPGATAVAPADASVVVVGGRAGTRGRGRRASRASTRSSRPWRRSGCRGSSRPSSVSSSSS